MIKRVKFKYIIYIIELLILYIMQQIKIFSPEIYGGRALYILPCFIFIAVHENQYIAMLFGIFTGLLIDIGYNNVIGIETIILCFVGYILGKISTKFVRANIITHFLYTFIVSLLVMSSRFLFFYVLKGYGDYNYVFLNHYLSCIIYTSLISPIIYLFNRGLYHLLDRREEI